MCSYLMLEIKYFVSLKYESFLYLGESTFQGRELSSPKFWGGLLIKRGFDRSRIFLVGLGKKGWGQYLMLELIPWRTLLVRSPVIMTWNKFITKWNLARVSMMPLEVISQKSAKIHCGEFFYHVFKLWTKIF